MNKVFTRVSHAVRLVANHRRPLLTAAAALMALLVAIGPVSAVFPVTCTPCHQAERNAWSKSPHASVKCAACHTERAALGGIANSGKLVRELRLSVFGPAINETAWIQDASCTRCHSDIESLITESAGLRMSHRGLADGGFRCVECHRDVAHADNPIRSSQPAMSVCAGCHNDLIANGDCELCHTGQRSAGEAQRIDAEWAVTHGPNWERMHGMGNLSTCVLCHPQSKCVGCHKVSLPHDENFGVTHGAQTVSAGRTTCLSACHTDSFCRSCHGIDMPHPVDFYENHPSIATSLEDEKCAACHTTENCNECHARHAHPGKADPLRRPENSGRRP